MTVTSPHVCFGTVKRRGQVAVTGLRVHSRVVKSLPLRWVNQTVYVCMLWGSENMAFQEIQQIIIWMWVHGRIMAMVDPHLSLNGAIHYYMDVGS